MCAGINPCADQSHSAAAVGVYYAALQYRKDIIIIKRRPRPSAVWRSHMWPAGHDHVRDIPDTRGRSSSPQIQSIETWGKAARRSAAAAPRLEIPQLGARPGCPSAGARRTRRHAAKPRRRAGRWIPPLSSPAWARAAGQAQAVAGLVSACFGCSGSLGGFGLIGGRSPAWLLQPVPNIHPDGGRSSGASPVPNSGAARSCGGQARRIPRHAARLGGILAARRRGGGGTRLDGGGGGGGGC